ncbi:geranylgeranylglyceryl/heptaprenylglyceryl phosphate synthase [Flavobacterium chuncheonense]|uniref:Geranylgeranylglyceryl phosphate synthase n=1 Tax=Flavobacterium chuncheonense TaxID=2026653 RepID=A0ABW5YQ40_9FLAO
MNFYGAILQAKIENKRLLAVLLDPDKLDETSLDKIIEKINTSPATHILVGGSTYCGNSLDVFVLNLKANTNLPVFLFPGNYKQISNEADGILFLSLMSGRNPDYLVEHQIKAVPFLEKSRLEIMPTAYLLIESGAETTVERVSKTRPIARTDVELVCQTAKAGEYLGQQLVYLEAGSGAQQAVPYEMIQAVSQKLTIPLIVGGGIRSKKGIDDAFNAGADMVVIGTAFENDNTFFESC